MTNIHPLFRANELGRARRRRLAEKALRWLRVPRRRALHIASFIR